MSNIDVKIPKSGSWKGVLYGVVPLITIVVPIIITTIVIHKKTQMPYIIAVPVSALICVVGLGVISTIPNVQNASNAIDRQISPLP
jgi:hypothetical protein